MLLYERIDHNWRIALDQASAEGQDEMAELEVDSHVGAQILTMIRHADMIIDQGMESDLEVILRATLARQAVVWLFG